MKPTQGPSIELSQVECEEPVAPKPESWKEKFTVGNPMTVSGVLFYVAAINRRGITLRRLTSQSQQMEQGPTKSQPDS